MMEQRQKISIFAFTWSILAGLVAYNYVHTYTHRGTEPITKSYVTLVCTYVYKVHSRLVPNGYIAIILWGEEFHIHT